MPSAGPQKKGALVWLRVVLFIAGICSLGYYAYATTDEYVYQKYENWAFDQQIAAGRKVEFTDYLREKTPFAFLAGTKESEPVPAPAPSATLATPRPENGSVLGRVEIGRLHLSAMVREGVDAKTLSLAVGHVPSTALPGQAGNFAIAAHRDTLFRALKDIKKDDLVTFQSPNRTYTYQVITTKIVKPSDISVLQPDGGGSIVASAASQKLLTMITCYPFYFVGSAPKRFIVQAKLISSDAESKASGKEARNTGPPGVPSGVPSGIPAGVPAGLAAVATQSSTQEIPKEPRLARGSSRLRPRAPKRQTSQVTTPVHPAKRRGFWHRLLHL